jgi:tetratricopeptide (TPR) repeat protein
VIPGILILAIISQFDPAPKPAGLGGCFVSLADDPAALYYNPAGIAGLEGKNFLIVPKKPLDYRFIGYAQKISDKFGIGVSFLTDSTLNDSTRGSLSVAYNIGKGRIGLSGGWEGKKAMFDLGLLYPRLAFKEIPGAASFGFSSHIARDLRFQFGVGYSYKIFRALVEPEIAKGRPLKTHLGIQCVIPINRFFKSIELAVGYNGDSLTAGFSFDFSDLRLDLGYSRGIKIAALLRTRVREHEVIAEIVSAQHEKEKAMSTTYLDQGVAYFNQGRFDEALNAWDLALLWNPDNTEAQTWLERGQTSKQKQEITDLLNKAKEEYNTSNFVDAMATCQAVLAIDSTNSEAKLFYQKATDDFTKFIFEKTQQSEELSGYFQAGAKEFVQGNYPAAEENWQKVLQKSPNNPEAKQLTSQAKTRTAETIAQGLNQVEKYAQAGQFDLALRFCDRLLRLAPDDKSLLDKQKTLQSKIQEVVSVHISIGKEKFNKGEYLTAEKEFRYVLAFDPKNSAAANYLDRIDERIRKNDVDALYRMGIEAYTQEHYEVAIDLWKQVLKVNPNHKDSIRNIERARLKLKAIGQ